MVDLPQTSVNTDRSDELCFGCGQKNPVGLKMIFTWDGEVARSEFTPGRLYQGYPEVVHGGILCCMLDDAMNHAAYFAGMDCLTIEMAVKFRRPARVDEPLVVTAWITGHERRSKRNKRLIDTEGRVTLPDGTLVAEGKASWFVVDKDGSREKESAGNAR